MFHSTSLENKPGLWTAKRGPAITDGTFLLSCRLIQSLVHQMQLTGLLGMSSFFPSISTACLLAALVKNDFVREVRALFRKYQFVRLQQQQQSQATTHSPLIYVEGGQFMFLGDGRGSKVKNFIDRSCVLQFVGVPKSNRSSVPPPPVWVPIFLRGIRACCLYCTSLRREAATQSFPNRLLAKRLTKNRTCERIT